MAQGIEAVCGLKAQRWLRRVEDKSTPETVPRRTNSESVSVRVPLLD